MERPDPKMQLYKSEIFGPWAPIYTFSTEEEAVTIANDTEYGLATYLFTRSSKRQWRLSYSLESGSVGINTTSIC